MRSFFQLILKHKTLVLIIFILASLVSALLSRTVSVNYNMVDYLPDNAKSTLALKVMKQEYQQDVPNVRVMIPNITLPRALEYKNLLLQIEGVEEVRWLDDTASLDVPLETLPQKAVEAWYKDSSALYSLTVDSRKQVTALESVRKIIGEKGAMSGACVNTTVATVNTGAEINKIMMIAIPIVFIILLLTTSSWFEPILFLTTIGVAILLNMGTNAIFGEISFVSKAAGSVLQLAVSMDYSIFLLHRFAEYRQEGLDVQQAMLEALKKSFSSITASGVTTVIGFAALILMHFKIGPDMGLVMAKAIFFSLLCVLILLPVLAILCYKLIDRTHHASLMPELKHFKGMVLKIKVPALILFTVIILPVLLAQASNAFLYGSSEIFGNQDTQIGRERLLIEETFGKSNQMVLMVPKGDLAKEKLVSQALQDIPQVSSIISYVDSVGAEIPMEYIPHSQLSQLVSKNYSRMILTVKTDYEGEESFRVVEQIRDAARQQYGEAYQLVGESVNTYDMRTVVTEDNKRVNFIAIAAVGVVLLLTFKSVTIPLILLLVIEASVWMNLAIPYFSGESIFFIAYLIISSVQLGATVDYAILFANRYLENRRSFTKTEAAKQTIADTTISILTSASILATAGTILGIISTNRILSQLGYLIGRGAVFSSLLVLLILPALLVLLDKPIQKTTLNCNFINREEEKHA